MSISVKRRIKGFSTNKATLKKPAYNRNIQLPKLIGLWPKEIADETYEVTARIVALLQKALRAERRRGQSGHWTYDLNRHVALTESLKEEENRLRTLARAEEKAQPTKIRLNTQAKPVNMYGPPIRTLAQLSLNSIRQSGDSLPGL